MTEDTHRAWDIIFKWMGLYAVLLSAWWTVHTYNQGRTKEQNSFVFQHQATLYFEATRAAATLAMALDTASDDDQAMSSDSLKAERERFEQLYWGELGAVEDRLIELAMMSFRSCLMQDGKNCEREEINQFGKPISKDVLKKLHDPLLLNMSLELAACTRTALEEDRGISLGATKQAAAICPYD